MATSIGTRSGTVVATLALAVAASCGSGTVPALPPGPAADTLARNLGLDDEQTSCMRSEFERAPGAAAVLDTQEAASEADRDRFLGAIRDCLPPEDFGTALAVTVRDELPEATEAQARCVQDNVVTLAPAEQDRLYLYFSNPALLDVADVGPAGADLLSSCDLGGPADEPSTAELPVGPTTTSPG